MVLTELAWAAGFLDGEGSIHIHYTQKKPEHRPSMHATVTAAQTHLAPLERLREVLGGKIYGPYKTTHGRHADHWQWKVSAKRATQGVLNKLLPLLSMPKQEQARQALIEIQLYQAKPRGRWAGHIRGQWHDPEWRRAYQREYQRARRAKHRVGGVMSL